MSGRGGETRSTTQRILLGVLIVLALGPGSARAEEPKESRVISDRLRVRIAGSATVFDTDIAAGKRLGLIVNLEDDLQFDKRVNTFLIGGFYRLGQSGKNAIRFVYTTMNRTAAGELAGRLEFFDATFVGAYESQLKTHLLGLSYRRTLFGTERGEAGVSAGLSTYSFDVSIAGSILVEGGGGIQEGAARSADVIAPVPTVGLFMNYAVRHDLIFEFGADYLNVSIGDYSGRISELRGSLTWFFSRHVGFGVGLTGIDIGFEWNTGDEKLLVEFQENAVAAFFDVVF